MNDLKKRNRAECGLGRGPGRMGGLTIFLLSGRQLIKVGNGHLVDDSITTSAVISLSVLHSEATEAVLL